MATFTLNEIVPGKTPGTFAEVDDSGSASGSFELPLSVLVVGGRTSAATVAAGTLVQITGDGQGGLYHGAGSTAAQAIEVARGFKTTARRVELWSIGVADAGGGVAATGSIDLSGTATAAGQLVYLVGGRRVEVDVAVDDTAAEIATAAAAVDHSHTAVTAADGTAAIDFTARNDGTAGNDISIVVLEAPAGITTTPAVGTITTLSSGATNPTTSSTITAIAGRRFTHIILCFNDATWVAAFETEMERRAGPYVDQRGHVFVGYRGSLNDGITYGNARNSQYLTIAALVGARSAPWELAAWACMAHATEAHDPARPLNGVSGASRGFEGTGLAGITPPAREALLQPEDHELLLDAGLSPLVVDDRGGIEVLRMITARKEDDNGLPTDLWLDVSVPFTLAALIYTWQLKLRRTYPRHKLADDSNPEGIPNVARPKDVRSLAIQLYDSLWVRRGWVNGGKRTEFVEELIVERDDNDISQVNVRMPPSIIAGAHRFATQFQLRVG